MYKKEYIFFVVCTMVKRKRLDEDEHEREK